MTDEEKQIANERLAKLCGIVHYESGSTKYWYGGFETAEGEFLPKTPDFYSHEAVGLAIMNGAYWREKAEEAILNKIREHCKKIADMQIIRRVNWSVFIMPRGKMYEWEHVNGRDDTLMHAKLAAILAALTELEQETATP